MSTTDELADDIEASDVDSDVDRYRKDESKRRKNKKKKVHRISGNLLPSSRNSGNVKDTDYLDDEEDETLISSLTFNDVRSKKKEKTSRKEEKTPRSPKKKKKKGKTELKTKTKQSEPKDKKKKKKIEKSEEEIGPHHKILLEQALRRVSDRGMENPSEIFLISGDSGVGKSHWIESETKRILQTIRQDESDNDSEETDEISEDDNSQFFPVVCRGTCEIPPRRTSAHDDDHNKNVGDSSTEAFYKKGCGISRSPMHAITEALNNLIRSLMISNNFQEGIGEPEAMSNTSEIFGSKEVWKKRIEEALGTTEASHLASTGLVPELAVLLNLPGLRHVSERKRIMQLWDWNTPYRFHRSCLAIRDLLRAITEYHHPVIMVINNLHYADKDTYRLLNFILTGCHWDEEYAADDDDESEELALMSGAEAISSTATRLQNFLFVGLHEENSTTRNNMLHSLEYSFRRRKKPSFEENWKLAKTREQSPIHSHVTKICMEPFSIRRVGDVLRSTILNLNETKIRDEDETFDFKEDLDELARIIYEWTGGNIFYVMQVFEYLKEEGAITLASSRKLNMNKVQAQSRQWNNSTIGLIAARIVRLPKALRFVLINASVFRQTHLEFSINELFHLFDAAYGQTKKGESGFPLESISELESALNLACDLGFMKRTTCRWNSNEKSHRWAFAHTMIRDEAYSLFAKKKIRKKMETHLILGTKASALAFVPTSSEQEQDERSGDMSLSNVEYDTFKFLAADQLAIAEDILDQDYNGVAIMFVETAEMCILKSAFFAAIRYLNVGLGILERNGGCFTSENHGICLKSYLLLARLYAVCGLDTNEIEKVFREIAKNGKNLKDQIMLHQAEIGISMGKKNYQEALKRVMSSLELLGEILPQKVDGSKMISRQIENVIQETRRRDNQKFLQPAQCTDKKIFDTMTLLSNWIEISRLCENEGYQELAAIRMMNICLISGFTPQYSMSFAHFGAILMERSLATNDSNIAKEGYRMGQICEKTACVNTFYGMYFHHVGKKGFDQTFNTLAKYKLFTFFFKRWAFPCDLSSLYQSLETPIPTFAWTNTKHL
jgi:predicted ATPase